MPNLDNKQPNRRLTAMYKIVRSWFPKYDFLGKYPYRVVSQESDDRLKLQTVTNINGLPNIVLVKMYPGIAGALAKLTPGCQVVIEFLTGDPNSPIVTGFTDSSGAGFLPINIVIDAVSSAEFSFIEIGKSTDRVVLGNADAHGTQFVALYLPISTWAAGINAYLTALSTILQGTILASPPGTPVVSISGVLPPTPPLSVAASSQKVIAQ